MEKSMKTFMLTQLIIGMVTILVGALMFFPFTLDHQWKESPELYGETINLDLEKFFGKEAVVQGKIITFIEPNSKELVFKNESQEEIPTGNISVSRSIIVSQKLTPNKWYRAEKVALGQDGKIEVEFKKYFALNIVGLIGFVFLFVGVLYL